MVRRNSQDPLTPSSTHTQRSNRTSVNPTTTKSNATKHDTNLATAPEQKAIRVKLRTYSRVPLHLRGKTPPTSDTRRQSNVKNDSTIADSNKVIADVPTRTTRVGRTIQTPARFVQMVHAVVAPNDIYGGTNRKYRSNNSYNL